MELAFLLRYVKDAQTFYVELLEGLIGWGCVDGKYIIKVIYLPIQVTPQALRTEGN